ncbi:MAG: hypothetical protein PSV16_09580 [Flavobacterium sp.]|nr:hypothetical protein [Flavobacterium sp.]
MKLNKFLILILTANFALAQQTTAKIQKVKASGFHKIVISPELRSLSQTDLSDFRIYDAKHTEVPYLKIEENDNEQHYDFEEYTTGRFVEQKNITPITIHIPLKEISTLTLFIANTSVNKTYNLYGSNDYEHWFGITENQKLDNLTDAMKTYAMKTISFPRCSYRHLKIVFDDKKTLPINVLRVGNLKPTPINGIDLLPVEPDYSEITNTPGTKKTLVYVRFKNPTVVNKLVFHISGQSYYNRKVRVYKKVETIRKRKKTISWETITQFDLTSYSNNIFPFNILEKEFYMEIDNGDNSQLQINDIQYFQIPVEMAVDLKSNDNYTIKTGNPQQRAPQYDLSYFRDSIPKNLPEAILTDIKTQSKQENAEAPKPFWQSAWFLWTCIGVGGIALLLFTRSLMKDMKSH